MFVRSFVLLFVRLRFHLDAFWFLFVRFANEQMKDQWIKPSRLSIDPLIASLSEAWMRDEDENE